MGLFRKRRNKDEDFKMQLEREALERLSQDEFDYTLPYDEIDPVGNSVASLGHSVNHMHHSNMITAEEIAGKEKKPPRETIDEDIKMTEASNVSSTEFLYKKMTEVRQNSAKSDIINEPKISENSHTSTDSNTVDVKDKPVTENIEFEPRKEVKNNTDGSNINGSANIKNNITKTEPVQSEPTDNAPSLEDMINSLHSAAVYYSEKTTAAQSQIKNIKNNTSAENDISLSAEKHIKTTKDNISLNQEEKIITEPKPKLKSKPSNMQDIKSVEEQRVSLMARLDMYINEGINSQKGIDAEKYKLESVDSILEGMEKKATQTAIKNHSITFDKVSEDTVTFEKKPQKDGVTELSAEQILQAVTNSKNTVTEEKFVSKKSALEDVVSNSDNNLKSEKPKVKHLLNEKENAQKQDDDNFKTRVLEIVGDTPKKAEDVVTGTRVFKNLAENFSSATNTEKMTADTTEDMFAAEEPENIKINDYCSVKDRARVGGELKKQRFKFSRNSFFTFIILLLSVILLTPVSDIIKDFGLAVFHTVNLFLLIISATINYNVFLSFKSVIDKKINCDLSAAVGTLSVAIYTLVQLAVGSNTASFVPLAVLSLFFNAMGKASKYKRVLKNFAVIADESDKKAITILSNPSATSAIVGTSIDGDALLCCGTKTSNILDFLKNSYHTEPSAKHIGLISIIGFVASIVSFIITVAVSSGDFIGGVMSFAAVNSVTSAVSTMFISNLPLKLASDRLNCYGAMLTGYSAAEHYDNCNAIATDCKELFPDGTIRMIDMKPLSKNPVYQSIIDAIALTEYIGSPLSGMFKQAIDVPTDKKIKVDTVVYEDKMGISGWVNDQKVFIGNRVLLESHGITNIPDIELDKKIMRKGYFPIYLATENTPCILFVARYLADSEISYELRRLCNTGTTVMVKNCDPNITSHMLSDYFQVMEGSINVMSKRGADQYTIISAKKEGCSAGASYSKSVCGLFATLTASIKLKKLISVSSALFVICTVIGILVTMVLSVIGNLSAITPVSLIAFQLISAVITCLPPLISKP